MILVGEKINTSRPRVARAVRERDAEFIRASARRQAEAGATYIDVNAGTLVEGEAEALCWLVETVQGALDVPLCLDSADPDALARAKALHRGEAMINSISLERGRFESLLPVVLSSPCHVVGLCMGETSMPSTADERVRAGSALIGRLTAAGIPLERIFIDPLLQPVSVDTRMGTVALESMARILRAHPGVRTLLGLSNVSFGLPLRGLVNRTFLAMALGAGLHAALLDPTDRELMTTLRTAEMLLGLDEYCSRFLDAYQEGGLPG